MNPFRLYARVYPTGVYVHNQETDESIMISAAVKRWFTDNYVPGTYVYEVGPTAFASEGFRRHSFTRLGVVEHEDETIVHYTSEYLLWHGSITLCADKLKTVFGNIPESFDVVCVYQNRNKATK